MKLLSNIKKHQYYLYISVFFIVLFFIANSLISNKITLLTKELNEFVVNRNIKTKYNTLKFEFNNLSNFIYDAEKLINSSKNSSQKKLKQKLLLITELAVLDENIDNGFMFFIKNNKVLAPTFLNNENTKNRKQVISQIQNSLKPEYDTILKYNDSVYNRKAIVKKIDNSTYAVIGYDINLLKYWNHFSQSQLDNSSYTVLTNNKGVCILHPDPKYIGVRIDSFFKKTSLQKVLKASFNPNDQIKNLIQTRVISEFLNLEVLRYFKPMKVGKNTLVLMVNFPVDISIKETITSVKKDFLWLAMLALCTFTLLLIVARLQLKREFAQKLKFEKEKEKLAISNEKIKQENAILQLNQLKKKMNPHFLFNSLNSLLVLIDIDTNLSQKFTQKLADVYRYFLENRKESLITVKEELNFLEHYFFLHKIRFKNSLNLDITKQCDKDSLLKKIPFLALETLVENAIKHNEFTKENPLFIKIVITNTQVIVTNNYNPRKIKQKNSHYIGLNYLENSYKYYGVNSFKVKISNKKFSCYLPLLS